VKSVLSCKVCGYESKNLVPHIDEVHADQGGIDWYLREFRVTATEVMHESIMSVEERVAGKVMIAGVGLDPIKTPSPFVPTLNPDYYFPEFTKNLCLDIIANKRVMLVGHTGCGKTSIIDQIASRINQTVLRVNMHGQTTIGEFLGLWTVKGGEMVWADGALPLAMRNGWWIMIDEIDFAVAQALSGLNSPLEPGGKLCLQEKGHEIVAPHKDFRIFATANAVGCMSRFRSMYPGTNMINTAFLDRWRVHKVNYLPAREEAKVLAAVLETKIQLADSLVRVANMARSAFEREELSHVFSLRMLIDWGEMFLRTKDAIEAAEVSIFSKVSPEDAQVIKGLINNVIPASGR